MTFGEKEKLYMKYLQEYDSKIEYMAWDFCTKHKSNLLSQEDIEQEIRIALLESIDSFDINMENQFSTFFYSVVNNLLKNIIRRESADKRKANNCLIKNKENVLTTLEICDNLNTEDEVILKVFLETVSKELDSIDKELLKVIFDMTTVNKVAEKTNRGKSGLYKRVSNLKKKLQEEYKKWR